MFYGLIFRKDLVIFAGLILSNHFIAFSTTHITESSTTFTTKFCTFRIIKSTFIAPHAKDLTTINKLIYVEIPEDHSGDSDYFTISINGKTWCKFQDEQRAEIMFDMFCKHIDDYLTFDTLLDMPEELRTASSGPDEW